jgi:hypothetical protein
VPLDPAQASNPALTPAEVAEVASVVTRLAGIRGAPLDVEFALEAVTGGGRRIIWLQARPLTRALPPPPPKAFGPWTPAGKGAWALESSHIACSVTPFFQVSSCRMPRCRL